MDPLKKNKPTPRISIDDRLKLPEDDEMDMSEEEEDMNHKYNTKPFSHQQQEIHRQPSNIYPSLKKIDVHIYNKTIINNSVPSASPPKLIAKEDKQDDIKKYLVPIVIGCIGILIGLLMIMWIFNPSDAKIVHNDVNLPLLTDHIYSMGTDFPGQSNSFWTTIVSGIKDFYTEKPQKPCIILLFGNEDTKKTAECLVQEVASKVIGDIHEDTVTPAFIDAANIKQTDYGKALIDLRSKVVSQKVLIIKNLQDMKGSVAESLHALCDRYNPAEREAFIIFTLHGVPYSSNAAEIAQRILTEQWKNQVPEDKLPALVTRITSRVVAVSTETNLPEKCSKFSN